MPSFTTIPSILAEERRLVGLSTNLALNDAEHFADGDQTPIRRVLPGSPGQELVTAGARACPLAC